MDRKRIAVIGAGASGLTAIKECLGEGLEPVCFERDSQLGGLWRYRPTGEHGVAGVYRSCVINTSKEMSAFSDFPVPAHYPPFMPHTLVYEYLRSYAQHFNLHPHIRFNTNIDRIDRAVDHVTSAKWDVTFTSDGEQRTETFDGVMVCTGHHSTPNLPRLPGLDGFRGRVIHSQLYRTPDAFLDKRVLIVGMGNSAVDIAVDLSNFASKVLLSTRRGAWIVSRLSHWGIPTDLLANSRAAFTLPRPLLGWAVEKLCSARFDHEQFGLRPAHGALQAHPTVSDELPYRIATGKVSVRADVARFAQRGVHFTDSTFEQIDAVILATGYKCQYGFLPEDVGGAKGNPPGLYKHTLPPAAAAAGLALIGLVQPVGSSLPVAELQSRWVARLFSGKCALPSECAMRAHIARKREQIAELYVESERHAIEEFWIPFMDELADEIGVRPRVARTLLFNPALGLRLLFGPCVPAQFRLEGPGSKPVLAAQTIRDAVSNSIEPMKTRVPAKRMKLTRVLISVNGAILLLYLINLVCSLLLGKIP